VHSREAIQPFKFWKGYPRGRRRLLSQDGASIRVVFSGGGVLVRRRQADILASLVASLNQVVSLNRGRFSKSSGEPGGIAGIFFRAFFHLPIFFRVLFHPRKDYLVLGHWL
jgi:hypothetical protein